MPCGQAFFCIGALLGNLEGVQLSGLLREINERYKGGSADGASLSIGAPLGEPEGGGSLLGTPKVMKGGP
jgi:hypothetical protein